MTVSVDWHHFLLDEPSGGWINAAGFTIRPGDPDASSDLGDEMDLLIVWNTSKALSFLGSWSRFFPGGFVKDTGGDPDADFGYVQVRVIF